jgi:hypothetical protein
VSQGETWRKEEETAKIVQRMLFILSGRDVQMNAVSCGTVLGNGKYLVFKVEGGGVGEGEVYSSCQW